MRVLLNTGDKPVASFLRQGLEGEGCIVDLAEESGRAKAMIQEAPYDFVILDFGPSLRDGFEVLADMRALREELPILVLTGRMRTEDRIKGWDVGADAYITKPFSYTELSARMRALKRRDRRPSETELKVRDLELNRLAHTTTRNGRRINLTPREFALLEYLMSHAGQRMSRASIFENVWHAAFDGMTNVVDVYINYLRRKVDDGYDVKLIRTVRGVGYQIDQAVGQVA